MQWIQVVPNVFSKFTFAVLSAHSCDFINLDDFPFPVVWDMFVSCPSLRSLVYQQEVWLLHEWSGLLPAVAPDPSIDLDVGQRRYPGHDQWEVAHFPIHPRLTFHCRSCKGKMTQTNTSQLHEGKRVVDGVPQHGWIATRRKLDMDE